MFQDGAFSSPKLVDAAGGFANFAVHPGYVANVAKKDRNIPHASA